VENTCSFTSHNCHVRRDIRPEIKETRLASARKVLFDITTGIKEEVRKVIAKRSAWDCER